jgi:hypothetical protein
MQRKKRSCCLLIVAFVVTHFLLLPQVSAQEPTIKATVQPQQAETTQGKTPAGGKQPAISFDATSFDAGTVWEGEIVIHSFVVKNTGNAELTLSNVKPG